jgi:hypothetical protein
MEVIEGEADQQQSEVKNIKIKGNAKNSLMEIKRKGDHKYRKNADMKKKFQTILAKCFRGIEMRISID